MGLTSERLKALTRRKLELVRELDKTPTNEALKESLRLLEDEIRKERTVVVNGPEAISPKPEKVIQEEGAAPEKVIAAPKRVNAGPKIAGEDSGHKKSAAEKEKSLKDFF